MWVQLGEKVCLIKFSIEVLFSLFATPKVVFAKRRWLQIWAVFFTSEYGLKVCRIDGKKTAPLSNFEFSENVKFRDTSSYPCWI